MFFVFLYQFFLFCFLLVFSTIPFDTAKVRLQTQDPLNPKYRGLVDVLKQMTSQEGLRSPWKGVTAGIQR